MSTPAFPQQPAGEDPLGNRSNNWIIVLLVAAVLAIPAVCVCGAAGVVFWTWVTPSPPIEAPISPSPKTIPRQAPEPQPPEEAPPRPKPQPSKEIPPIESKLPDGRPVGKALVGKRTLFTLKPFTRDKALMPANTRVNFRAIDKEGEPTAAVTLLQFFPDRDPQLHEDKSFVTGFRINAQVSWPITGVVSFHVLGVGSQTTITVSIGENSVWTYQGGPEESVASPPVPLAGKQNEAQTFNLSLAVDGGEQGTISGIQSFLVYEEPKERSKTNTAPNDAAEQQVEPGQTPTGSSHLMVKKRAFLTGHTGQYVRCVAFSRDGKTLASGGDDATVKLWDVATGKVGATLQGHTDEVWYVAFLPDGKTVVSGSLDGSVRVWDVAAAKQKASLVGFVPAEEMTWGDMALAPDGKTLAALTNEKALKLVDLESGKERRRLKGNWGIVAFSHDGKTLALVGGKGLELRDLASGEARMTFRGNLGCVAFSPDDKTLAVEVDEGTEGLEKLLVKLINVGTGRLKASFRVETVEEGIMSLAFSPNGKTLAVGRYMDGLQFWDLTTGKLKADLPPAAATAGNTQYAVSLTFSPDGKILAAGGFTTDLPEDKGVVRLWDIAGEP